MGNTRVWKHPGLASPNLPWKKRPLFDENAFYRRRGERVAGGIAAEAALWRQLYGRIAEIVSPITVEWATKIIPFGGGQTCTFFTIPFANLRGNVVRTFLGSLISTGPWWSSQSSGNALCIQSSVPTMFLHFFANRRVTNGRIPPFPNLGLFCNPRRLISELKSLARLVHICCEVIIWAKFGHFRCYYLGQVGVIIWAKLFLAYKNSGFKRFLAHTIVILCFFLCPIIWQLSKNSLFQKKGAKIGFFKFLCFKLIFGKFSFFRFAKTL